MVVFLDTLLNGLTLGAFYALVTLGLALIFGVARLINFAHGDFFMVGGYVLYLAIDGDAVPYWLAIVLVTVAVGVLGVVFERLVVHAIVERPWWVHLVATLATSIILSNTALLVFRSDARQVPTSLSTTIVEVVGTRTSVQRLVVLVAVVVVFLWLRWFLGHTWTGRAMRAISQNRETCAVVGVDVRRVVVITFGISAGLAGLAAALLSPLYSVSPGMGRVITLKALAAVVMGGLGQVTGAFSAAFLIGLVESFYGAYVPQGFTYRDAASFALLLAVLMVRPHGLFGRRVGL